MALRFEPFLDAELVFSGTEETGLVKGSVTTVVEDSENLEENG